MVAPPIPTAAVAGKLSTGGGVTISDDSSGNLAIYGPTGVKIMTLSGTGGLNVGVGGPNFNFAINNSGLPTKSNGVTLAGQGFPLIVGVGAQTLYTNAAPTTLSVTPASAVGVYRLHGYLDILTGGTLTFAVIIGYTDPGGNARTDVPVFIQQNSTSLVAGGPSANSTGRFTFTYDFAVDNSGTAITIGDNSGTYAAGTYYWVPILERLI